MIFLYMKTTVVLIKNCNGENRSGLTIVFSMFSGMSDLEVKLIVLIVLNP